MGSLNIDQTSGSNFSVTVKFGPQICISNQNGSKFEMGISEKLVSGHVSIHCAFYRNF